MILTRWAAAFTLLLVTIVGCQKTNKEDNVVAPPPTSDEKVAAAVARYAAMPGVLAGQVDAVKDGYASVGGIDAKALNKGEVLTFIDAESDHIFCSGTFSETGLSGRLVVEYDQQGERAPKKGDLCVKLKK